MTVKELIELDWNKVNKMTEKELKGIVQFGALQANRYIASAKKGGYTSPGLHYVLTHDRTFSSKNKNEGQLKSELRDLIAFLDNKTLTRKGAKAFYNKTLDRMTQEGYDKSKIKEGDMSKFWETYNKFLETDRGKQKFGSLKSKGVQDEIFNIMYNNDFDIEQTLSDILDEDYEWLDIEKGESPF